MSEARTDRTRMWVSIAVAMLVVAATGIGIWVVTDRGDDSALPASPTATTADDCGGVADQLIELNRQLVDPPGLLCFDIEVNSEITVGVAALDAQEEISFHLRDTAGGILAQAASDAGLDPQVVLVLGPGRYVIEVFGADDAEPPPFLVNTATFPSSATPSDPDADVTILPDLSQCGLELPWLTDDQVLPGSDDDRWACVDVEESGMVKVGAISADSGADTDLRLTLYGSGQVPVATNDDVFGLDPEVSTALDAGTYLVAVDAWFDAPTGEFDLYVDTDGDYWRRGEPSDTATGLTESVCSTAGITILDAGQLATVTGTDPFCLSVDSPRRLLLEAASVDGELFALEVLGFAADGSPQRIAWTSTDPAEPDSVDATPALDMIFPAETLIVVVSPLVGDGDVGAVDVRLVDPTQ